VLTGGAGGRAMTCAFDDLFGVPDAFRGIEMLGRTDAWIVATAAAAHHVAAGALAPFRDRYLHHLAIELEKPGPRKGIMPGVRPLLDTLAARPDVYLALLTGNYEEGARLKLEYFDLWRYFRCGAFGDDAPDRNGLLPAVLDRVRACGVPHVTPDHAVVIGDTPLDIACAAMGGARSLAVATGGYDVAALQAAGADVVFADLRDTDAVVEAIVWRKRLGVEPSPPA
jgi:phosphoglycolate phosphatase